jgi:hypothetical protein
MKLEIRLALAFGMLLLAAALETVLWKQGYALKTLAIVGAVALPMITAVACGRCGRRGCKGSGPAGLWYVP